MLPEKKRHPPAGAVPSPPRVVFGPVPSRRLGLSLGIDLVPAKTCTLDCVYCEAGRTTCATAERRAWIPLAAVLAQVDAALAPRPRLDHVTFSGAGEPTLHSGIGEVIRHIKAGHPEYRLCLLTNGTLLPDPGLRRELAPLDLIVPSLDAADEPTFRRLNRPAPGISCLAMPEAYAAFRRECPRVAFWLEVFVITGVNDHPAAVAAIRAAVARIRPDRVQLNTLDRPGTEPSVTAAGEASLQAFLEALRPLAPVEAIGRFRRSPATGATAQPDAMVGERIQAMLRRRPCTMDDLAAGLGLPPGIVQASLDSLAAAGQIVSRQEARGTFYAQAPGA